MYILKSMCSAPGGRRVRLRVMPETLKAIHTRSLVRPVSFNRNVLWAAFCLAFFPFLQAWFYVFILGKFQQVSNAISGGYGRRFLQPAFIYLSVAQEKQEWSICLRSHSSRWTVPHKAVCSLGSYFAVHSPVPGPFFVFEDGGCCLGSGWSLSSQLHCRKSGFTPHHTRSQLPYCSSHCSG